MTTFSTSGSGVELHNGSHTDGIKRLLPKRHVFKCTVCLSITFLLAMWCFDLSNVTQNASKRVTAPIFTEVTEKHQTINPTEGVHKSKALNNTYGTMGVSSDVLLDSGGILPPVMNQCPHIPPHLVGYIATNTNVPSLEAVENDFPDVLAGGHFRPKECTSRHRVAILIPFRNRAEHLKVFIYNLHKVLSRQQIDYGVFVIEQGDNKEFNRAKLLNIGFLESTALYDYQCFVFHDVDLVPSDDRNIYSCPEQPRHMSVWVDDHSGAFYKLFFGGVSALKKEHMLSVNGFSNIYWGWGGEDDDMAFRLGHLNLTIHRRPASVARYTSLKHVKAKPSPKRFGILNEWKERYKTDGLNSVKYKRLDMVFKKLYTWILVDLRGS